MSSRGACWKIDRPPNGSADDDRKRPEPFQRHPHHRRAWLPRSARGGRAAHVAQSRLVRDAAEARLQAAEPRLHHRLADPLRHEAVSAWLAWKALGKDEDRKLAFIWFFIQLALGVLWSYAFLWLHNPAFGLAVIMALLIALVITIVMFDRLSRIAALLLVPLALWVFYATALNFAFFMLS